MVPNQFISSGDARWDDISMRLHLAFGAFSFIVLGLAVLVTNACYVDQPKTVGLNVYKGVIPGYDVELIEWIDEGEESWTRIVQLHDYDRCGWCGITGHDDDSDGHWERIFWCGSPEIVNGCNSVTVSKDGSGWVQTPCSADEGKIAAFTDDEIATAQTLLDEAVRDVRHSELLVAALVGEMMLEAAP